MSRGFELRGRDAHATAQKIDLDPQDVASGRALRLHFAKFWSEAGGDPRTAYDRFIAQTPIASGVTFRKTDIQRSPGIWCIPTDALPGRAILFIHGGGYTLGSATAYRGFASQLAVRAETAVFLLDYPLSPETKLPVALTLAVDTLERLQERTPSIAVCGDSAGGGMTLASLDVAQACGIRVAAAAVFSPWTDLTLSNPSTRDFAIGDPLLDLAYLRAAAAGYLGEVAPEDPRASPVMDVRKGLPPILIQVGSDEVLLDDSRRYAEAARMVGNEVVLEVWQGMHHVFQLNVSELVSARRALDRTAKFLKQEMARLGRWSTA